MARYFDAAGPSDRLSIYLHGPGMEVYTTLKEWRIEVPENSNLKLSSARLRGRLDVTSSRILVETDPFGGVEISYDFDGPRLHIAGLSVEGS